MKRIETPSYASMLLDDFCCPIYLAGNYDLLVASHQRLPETFSGSTKAPILFNHFLPVQKSLPGYNYQIKNIKKSRTTYIINYR